MKPIINPTHSPVSTTKPIYMEYESLATMASKFGFDIGTVMSNKALSNSTFKGLVAHHFNSVTAANEMKAYSLLNQSESKASTNGMPVMDYTKADALMEYAVVNNLKVRGHTLVWDAYMSDWFFYENYEASGSYVDQATMKARLKSYITDVITHFEQKYPGVVYCWDVVNEGVADGGSDYVAGDNRLVRKYRNGTENKFYTILGSDYIELSFLYAKDTVDQLGSDIKLFYNDYNTFYAGKRDAICNLITSINSYAKDNQGNNRKLCDGMGMQSYIGGFGKQEGCMNDSDITAISTAIKKYYSLGVEVQATELAVRNYTNTPEYVQKHADFYLKLFQMYTSLNTSEEKPLTAITIWGLCDRPTLRTTDYGYMMNGPYCGLFNEEYDPMDSFIKIHNLIKNERGIQ